MRPAAPERVRPAAARVVGGVRGLVGLAVLVILLYTYAIGGEAHGYNPFDYFGYFTNLTSLLAALVLLTCGALGLTVRRTPCWLAPARAVVTACMLIVAVIYNTVVPGTGSAPAWVSLTLHAVLPTLMALDWLLIGDRRCLPWSRLWVLAPYPLLWLAVVLVRSATDGWVPYGFLLPERGATAMTLTVLGLLGALTAAGVLVWAASRFPGVVLRRGTDH
ncbi:MULTISPECIES: Pr6Pr family membrane protein [unclassified Microbacterium]|uniref:Pr6Pr family membrane protein n=1 Tax=unclassified Microbacterium TaxID=2609290 RepID=UPI0025D38DDE|nr:Pr6Pr family membrane protein [uncultured Microbacterium sp.]